MTASGPGGGDTPDGPDDAPVVPEYVWRLFLEDDERAIHASAPGNPPHGTGSPAARGRSLPPTAPATPAAPTTRSVSRGAGRTRGPDRPGASWTGGPGCGGRAACSARRPRSPSP